MFKKSNRLTTTEFSTFFAKGKRRHFEHFTCITAPYPTRKVAVVVGKKVAKSAVRRNLLKRRVYAQLRQLLPTQTGVYIVLLKPSFAGLSRQKAAVAVAAAVAEVAKSS